MIEFVNGADSLRSTVNFSEPTLASVCMWVIFNKVIGNNRMFGTDDEWEIRVQSSGLEHELRDGGGNPTVTTSFTTGVEYHIICTYDGTNKGVYVNGVADPTPSAFTHSAVGADTILHIGTNGQNVNQGLEGSLEDVRIYNRILTAAEADLIYNGEGLDGVWNGLIHWWPLNKGPIGSTPTSEEDIAGNFNLPTVVGSPTYLASPRRFIGHNY